MAVGTPVTLDQGTDTGAGPNYTTATSITPTANRAVFITILLSKGAAVGSVSSLSGCNLTWQSSATVSQGFDTIAGPQARIEMWWGIGASPTTGTITITTTTTETGCSWSIVSIPGGHTTTPVVAGSALANASDTTGTAASLALNALASSTNGYLVSVALNGSAAAITERSLWTELHDVAGITAPLGRLETQYRLATTDTASATWPTGGNQRWAIIGVELAAAAGGAAALDGIAVLALDVTASFAGGAAALDGVAALALDVAASTLTTGIALTGTATLALLVGADFPVGGLPIDARERAEAIEWYGNIGDFRVGTRDFVGPSWAVDESQWTTGWDFREIYRAAILDRSPDIDRALDNLTYGFVEVGRVRLQLGNLDGALNGLWGQEGAGVTMWRHDRLANVTVRELDGVLDTVSLEPGLVNVEITTQDLAALDTLVPRRLTSTALFGATCPDVGFPICAVLGTVENLPLLYVTDNLPSSVFLYLVGEGTLSVTTVRRNRIGETQLEALHASEWGAYPLTLPDGSTVTIVQTPIRQSATGGGFHQLYADVSGPSGERNPAVAFGRVLNDPVWGGGLPIDVENITSQATLMPAAPRLDGALGATREQRPLREVLAKILMVCGGRAQYDAFRGWQAHFDSAAPTSARMVLRDDAGPGEKTLLSIGRRVSPPRGEKVRTLQLQFAPDYVHDGAYLYTAADRAVGPEGRLKTLGTDGPGDFIRDRSAADWIAGYLALRLLFSQDRVEDAVTHEEGRRLQIGDLVRVICPQLQISGEDRRVVSATKGSGRQRLIHERWDASLYSPSAGSLPTLRSVSEVAGVPASELIMAPGSVTTETIEADAVSQAVRGVQMAGGVPDDTPVALPLVPLDFMTLVSATITTTGGVVDVRASALVSISDTRAQTVFYYVENQTRGTFPPLAQEAVNAATATSPGFATSISAEFYEDDLPAGTYTYRFRLIGTYSTAPTWMVSNGRLLIREVKR